MLLKTSPAQYWFALRGLKWNRRLCAAFGAFDARFSLGSWPLRTVIDPARLAALRIIRELLFMKESLLAGAEDELSSAIDALQNPISKFHDWALPGRK